VDPRADLEDIEKLKFFTLLGLELRPPGRPARSHSLFRLCYHGCISISTEICNRIADKYEDSSSLVQDSR
jgi:hypothetical protein